MPATKSDMLKEFEEVIYKDKWESNKLLDKKYINDLATIGAFLHPENSDFCEALQKLDDEMIKLFEKRSKTKFKKSKITLKSFSDFSHAREPGVLTDEGADATKHLLTTVLADFEKSEGFQSVDDQTGKCVCFYENLASDEFGGAIKSRHLAKDYVGDAHGAYTHRIQWYCAGVMKKELDLQSASMSACFYPSGSVWGIVFDRNAREGIALLPNDFRRPEIMNPWIANHPRHGNHCWPILSAFLKSRITRVPRGWTPDILKINLAKKLFPDKVKPSVNYRSNSAEQNARELESFKLGEEELKLVEKAAKGIAYDPVDNQLVSFSGGKKAPLK